MKSLPGFVLVASLAATGCEKPNDLPRLQDEALATAKIYQQRLDDLARRATALGPRVAALPSDAPDSARARQIYQQALATLEEHRRDLQKVPQDVQSGTKSGNPDELARLIDHTRETQDRAATEASAEISAVESWVAIAEQRHGAPHAAAPSDDRPSGSQAPAQ